MKQVLLQSATKLNKERKRRAVWQRVLSALSAVVVFCTTYALILPAITMDRDTACGMENHTHGEECFAPKTIFTFGCDVAADRIVHSHDSLCYDSGGGLICPLAELSEHTHEEACFGPDLLTCTEPEGHTHGDGCYEIHQIPCELTEEPHIHTEECTGTETVLICTVEESEAHTHGEECREEREKVCEQTTQPHIHSVACSREERVLICTQEETEGHVHGDSCWEKNTEPLCGCEEIVLHTHDTDCYNGDDQLICGQPQIVRHTHDETCRLETTMDVLVCQIPEHTHTDACYPVSEDNDSKYLCGSGEHTHHEGCYDPSGEPVCSIPEHTHEAACLVADLDLNADVETQTRWEEEIAKLPLTGVWAEDILTIAQSQVGYMESTRNLVLSDGALKGYTRYGQWKGAPYADWNTLFVSFCLEYAGLSDYPDRTDPNAWLQELQKKELFRDAEAETPLPGELVFFGDRILVEYGQPLQMDARRVGIVVGYQAEKDRLIVIEGDCDGTVEHLRLELEDSDVLGYGKLPQQRFYCRKTAHYHADDCYDLFGSLTCGLEPHVHNISCQDDSKRFEGMGRPLICQEDHTHGNDCYGPAVLNLAYEDERLSMTLSVTAPDGIPEGTRMEVVPMDTGKESYASYEKYATYAGRESLLDVLGYEVRFLLAGEAITVPDGRVTANITVKPVTAVELEDQGMTLMSLLGFGGEDPEESPDTIIVSVISRVDGTVTTADKVEFADGETVDGTVTIDLGLGRDFALMSETAPQFRVEFYANMPVFVSGSTETTGAYSSSIQIIDTRKNGDGTGGSLPRNGSQTSPRTDNGFIYLYLEPYYYTDQNGSPNPPDNNISYHVASEFKLTEIYKPDTRTYTPGMTTDQLNKIRLNSHYAMIGMKVSQDGGQTWKSYGMAIDDDDDVDVWIDDLSSLVYTNNPAYASDSKGIIYIGKDTVVRFTYIVLEGAHSNAVNFFDYDISDGNFHVKTDASDNYATFNQADAKTGGTVYINTNKQGINNSKAYAGGSGAEFAFGNNNTGMGRSDEKLGSAYINRYNRGNLGSVDTFNGCSFGIVSGYDIANDRLLYKSGVHYQALFNDETYYNKQSGFKQMGKTTYTGNMLNFRRIGDNYILVAVNGNGAVNGIYETRLDEFFVPNEGIQYSSKKRIFTNNFWPMDGTVTDNTPGHDPLFGKRSEYQSGHRGYVGTNTGTLPMSDDHNFHNSYFGMQYSVKFSLDGHYCGPLEYLFYGDDDMWVFLTDHQTGTSKLICDIGGVHSSVGSYTDLWDYIKKDEAGKGDYTLTFFYTERGSSGSSCFMSFTLPMITSISQNTPDIGSLSVRKDAIDESDPNATYTFKLELSGQFGSGDRYPYIISGTAQSTGTIASGETFTVAAGETFTVTGIPAGMKYAVTELFSDELSDAYTVTWLEGDGTSTIQGTIISDKIIEGGKTETLICTNSAVGTLKLLKEVDGTSTTETFYLNVTLADKDGNPVSGTFGGIEFTDGKAEVAIIQNQTIVISDLPVGTQWTVTEKPHDSYSPTYQVDGVDTEEPSGTITHDHEAAVTVINKPIYTLPNTGGVGTQHHTFGGLLLLAGALMYSFILLRRRRGEAEV